MNELDKDFVEYVVKALVDHPEDVKVERSVDDMGVLLELTVSPDDMGKVIGRAGATAKSIRTLLRVVGSREDSRVNLKIVEPEGSEDRRAAAAAETSEQEVVREEQKAPERDASEEMLERTKREFADLDDLDI
jgi:hypothetical protein